MTGNDGVRCWGGPSTGVDIVGARLSRQVLNSDIPGYQFKILEISKNTTVSALFIKGVHICPFFYFLFEHQSISYSHLIFEEQNWFVVYL